MLSQCRLFSVAVLFLLAVVSVPRGWAQTALENPQPDSFQSGIGVISGWACNAGRIEITFDGGAPQEAGYGTSRGDTRQVCGDTDNGFGLLFNWNLLGDGVHTVVAYADGVEFASTTVIVTTLGEAFLRGVSDSYTLADFPDPGATRTLRWQEAQQNFVISAGAAEGGGTSGRPPRVLENPQPGSYQSGIGVISGWVCDTQQIEISFNGGPTLKAGTGTSRGDTRQVCGDTDNGFGLLYNWNQLGNGSHHVVAYADGVEFARVDVTVTTLGTEFRRGLSHEVTLPDFPAVGTDVVLRWQEAQQNFVISAALPTLRLVAVEPYIALPSDIGIPNIAVSSLYSETAEVRAGLEPTLLLAEDAGGVVLLALANMDGGVLGEAQGEVEVSLDSTAVTLVGLAAGIAVSDMVPLLVDVIRRHPQYPALVSALSTGLAADPNFLNRLTNDPATERLIHEVAATLTIAAIPQAVGAQPAPTVQSGLTTTYPLASDSSTRIALVTNASANCEERIQRAHAQLIKDFVKLFGPTGADFIGLGYNQSLTDDQQECIEKARCDYKDMFNEAPPHFHPGSIKEWSDRFDEKDAAAMIKLRLREEFISYADYKCKLNLIQEAYDKLKRAVLNALVGGLIRKWQTNRGLFLWAARQYDRVTVSVRIKTLLDDLRLEGCDVKEHELRTGPSDSGSGGGAGLNCDGGGGRVPGEQCWFEFPLTVPDVRVCLPGVWNSEGRCSGGRRGGQLEYGTAQACVGGLAEGTTCQWTIECGPRGPVSRACWPRYDCG